jgi:hypothetical protein
MPRVLAQSNPDSLGRKVERAVETVVSNKYVIGVVGALAVAYLSKFMPELPSGVNKVVNNIIGQFVMLFVVTFVLTQKVTVAIICTLVVLILVYGSKWLLGNEQMKNVAYQEGRRVEQAPVRVQEGVLSEVNPLTSETVSEKVSEVIGYSNLWMNNEEVESSPEAPVEVASTVSAATVVSSSAVSSVAAPVSLSLSANIDVIEPKMPPVPTMTQPASESVTDTFMNKFRELKDRVKAANDSIDTLPTEINADAIVGVMNAKQTNLEKL